MILGIHCDVRKGPIAALGWARGLGCSLMQMFSYRRHDEAALEGAEGFKSAREAGDPVQLISHVRYLPFIGSGDRAWREHSVDLLEREMVLARALGARGLILHMGAYSSGSTLREGMRLFINGVREAWERSKGGVPLWVENVPGGGRRMGGRLEELGEAVSSLRAHGVDSGACLDTAHAWAQGFDLSTPEGMESFLDRARGVLGSDGVKAFHLNDSRALLGSFREDHRHWGEGLLGSKGLSALLARAEFRDTPGILETPPGKDAENLAFVRRLMSESAKP
ncbi:MAG: deoxyribonuclease IV [Elusimicrobiota bacterium]